MSRFPQELTRLIHENLSIVMSFAYSRKPLREMVGTKFRGQWKYLHKAVFEISEQRAERACLELALFLRTLDDDWEISDHFNSTGRISNCGRLVLKHEEKTLTFRDAANKMIHASALEWNFEKDEPRLVCYPRDQEKKWVLADIDLVALAAVCGRLAS
jgi:hypothetical protein